MVAVEYSKIDTEADWEAGEVETDASWPQAGKISLENYSTRYREGLDLVLRNISADINGTFWYYNHLLAVRLIDCSKQIPLIPAVNSNGNSIAKLHG